MKNPVLNITIPVFNRPYLTQKTILNLKKSKSEFPFTITVVDNGSEESLQKTLIDMEKNKIIDNLFLLTKNMALLVPVILDGNRLMLLFL